MTDFHIRVEAARKELEHWEEVVSTVVCELEKAHNTVKSVERRMKLSSFGQKNKDEEPRAIEKIGKMMDKIAELNHRLRMAKLKRQTAETEFHMAEAAKRESYAQKGPWADMPKKTFPETSMKTDES